MAAVTIYSDFGAPPNFAPKIKSITVSIVSPSIRSWHLVPSLFWDRPLKLVEIVWMPALKKGNFIL